MSAFSVEGAYGEQVVVVCEVERQYRPHHEADVLSALRRAVALEHGLTIGAVALIQAGSIPKTSSGKIQRHLCRSLFLEGGLKRLGGDLPEVLERSEELPLCSRELVLANAPDEQLPYLHTYLREQIARTLKLAPAQLHAEDLLSGLGIDSLAAVELAHHLETDLELVVPISHFLQDHT